MIRDATFTSVWDEGSRSSQKITVQCRVNMETGEAFDIETVDVESLGLEVFDREYVTIDGTQYPIAPKGEGTRFWYE